MSPESLPPAPTPRADHWEEVHRTKVPTEVSWHQDDPATSRRLIAGCDPRPRSIIDVGAGASLLVDALADDGFADLTVLDIAPAAIELVRARWSTREAGPEPELLVADLLAWTPTRRWDLWHDRAVFHFLTEPADQRRYADLVAAAVAPGGVAVIGTFAPDGPTTCSGLPTARHTAASIASAIGEPFVLEHGETEHHRTPWGADQHFTWAVLRRRPA